MACNYHIVWVECITAPISLQYEGYVSQHHGELHARDICLPLSFSKRTRLHLTIETYPNNVPYPAHYLNKLLQLHSRDVLETEASGSNRPKAFRITGHPKGLEKRLANG